MEVIEIPIEELVPYENNPRKNRKAIIAVTDSIEDYGFRNPILIDKDSVIIAGHTRYEAALKLGLKTVPCIRIENLSEEKVRMLRLADNKTGELSSWDFDLLERELDGLKDMGAEIQKYGFEFANLDEIDPDDIWETVEPEPEKDKPEQETEENEEKENEEITEYICPNCGKVFTE